MADTPEIDLNKFSTDDLIALKAGQLEKVSTQGLLMLKAGQPKNAQPMQNPNIITSDVPTVVGEKAGPAPMQEPATSMSDKLKALYEVPAAIGSSMVSQPGSMLYGLGKSAIEGAMQGQMPNPEARDAYYRQARQATQFQPTSPASIGALESIGGALEAAKIPPMPTTGMLPSYAQALKSGSNLTVKPALGQMAGALRNEAGMVAEAAQPVVNKMSESLRLKPSVVKTAPTSQKLLEESREAFDVAKQSGMEFDPTKFSTKMAEIGADLRKVGYTEPVPNGADPYAKITAALHNLESVKNPKDFEELSTLRTIIRNAQKSGDSTERKIATVLKDKFDDYVINAPQEDMLAATKQGAEAWKKARDTWSRVSKSEIFEDMLDKAEINASKVGTEKYLHNKLLALANDDKKMRLFTPTEQEAIRDAAKGGKIQNVLRLAGKYSPENMLGLATGSVMGAQLLGPAGAAIAPVVGGISNVAAKEIRKSDVNKLAAIMRAGKGKENE